MANLGRKGEVYVARFRHLGKEYKKSLRTTSLADARAAMHAVERAIHGLATGMLQLPDGVDAGDFILSGGSLRRAATRRPAAPSVRALVDDYLANQAHLAASYVYTQRVHLRNFSRALGARADAPADRIAHRDLERYLQGRLATRSADTVAKERFTLFKLFEWAVAQVYLADSPAAALPTIKGDSDRRPFRTIAEIEAITARGGLGDGEAADLWECLYPTPGEIGGLLTLVTSAARADHAHLLHAIPAYTGMRRGEILRLRWSDVEFDQDSIIARSRKQSRQKSETAWRIDLHAELKALLVASRDRRPRGQFVVCEPGSDAPLDAQTANRHFCRLLRGTTWCLDPKKR